MFRAFAVSTLLVLSGLVLLSAASLYGQSRSSGNMTRVPIFRSKKDSLRLLEIQEKIAALQHITPRPRKQLDSLIRVYYTSRDAMIVYRNVYKPSNDHISIDSLHKMKDLQRVTKVSVYNDPSTSLPAVLFQCKNLTSLELVNTRIRLFPSTLDSLASLSTLAIYNPIGIHRIKFQKNHHIDTLIIKGDNPHHLPRSFRPLSALRILDLSHNSLKRFPNGARHNRHLREIDVSDNALTLTRRIKKHRYIETLSLQHNEIRRVPRSIRNLRNLQKLSFNYNHIAAVHTAIRRLKNLEDLSFYHNELRAIPSGVYALDGLREIDLFYNQIKTIEHRVSGWKNLRTLHLSHNAIVTLPPEIGHLTSLEGLFLWDNKIEQLPESLGKLTTLRFLWVNNNNISRLPRSLFALKKLEELDLSHNQLSGISEAVFDFERIKILSLHHNPWNDSTFQLIRSRAETLRARNVFVNLEAR